jgi:hypothetical protein
MARFASEAQLDSLLDFLTHSGAGSFPATTGTGTSTVVLVQVLPVLVLPVQY